MNLFKKKENKQNGEEWIVKMALQEAMRELQEEKQKKSNLENELKQARNTQYDLVKIIENSNNIEKNLEVLQVTIENIKDLCKDKKVISAKIILKELGE